MVWSLNNTTRQNGYRVAGAVTVRDDSPAKRVQDENSRRRNKSESESFAILDRLGKPLHDKGWSDNAIRVSLRMSWHTVRRWRLARGLPANHRRTGRPRK